MRARLIGFSSVAATLPLLLLGIAAANRSTRAQSAPTARSTVPASFDSSAYLEWPLASADRAYGAIDGKHLWQYVLEQVAISRRYRDQGHPQFWGRIIGTSGDAESAQWLLGKFQQLGMTDAHIQPIDLEPQWMPQSWEITVESGGKTIPLTSAYPAYHTLGTQGQGLDLEAVYVELGSEADFAGIDVRGKAVFISRYPANFRGEVGRSGPEPGALARAAKKGAAVVFDVNELPGNLKYASYPANTGVPTFNLGAQDGDAIRDLIDHAPAGQAPHVHIHMDVQMVPNLKTALVWGTLPGATDETIYVIGHRDGWFDGASDNAGGIASMLGLAEYYAKLPLSQRRRTMVFVGVDGHHNTGPGAAAGETWMVAHREQLFAKTALMINDEHPANVDTYRTAAPAGMLGQTDGNIPLEWYAGGAARPELRQIAADAFQEFGLATWAEPSPRPPAGDMGRFAAFLPGVVAQSNDFFYMHTDANTPETVPWTALEAATRAYAKIIDQVNTLDLKVLQGPAPIAAQSQRSAAGQPAAASSEPNYLQWPLTAVDRAYGAIDGRHIWQYVVQQVAISRRYRDQGHAQFWGRIIGTSADAEDARWLADKFSQLGLSNVHIQSLDLAPQWIAQSWQVTLAGGGKALPLPSAQPFYATPPTPAQGLDLEAVYVGLGREADFARRDVRGKAAVVFYSGEGANYSGEQAAALKRAAANGAAAVFAVNILPNDIKIQPYPVDTGIPTISLALQDGEAVRDLIAQAAAGQAPHLRLRLDAQMMPNLKTALVWGTLPGATDETIYVTAHRDGWFDAAGDNAGGVASMIGLAEYFAKIPKGQRRRTITFIGLDGHHNGCTSSVPSKWCQPGAVGDAWLAAHHDELFAKTALVINDEHPSNVETYMAGDHSSAGALGPADTYLPQEWYGGGASRPELTKIVADAFREFGVTMWAQPSARPPAGDLSPLARFAPGVASSTDRFFYFHTAANTPETVPWTGLESTTRAYARIIDAVNKLDLKDMQRPIESTATPRRTAAGQ